MNFKPMLSASLDGVDLSTLHYPLLVSPKLDGLRCIVHEGVAYSRNAKPFRNRFVQKWASNFHNLDGEIIVGSPTEGQVLERSKAVTAYAGEPDFKFHLFDCYDHDGGFEDRMNHVQVEHEHEDHIVCVPHHEVSSQDGLVLWESRWLDQGYEGLMARHPNGPYKNGRSTLREGYLMKLKRFQDGEAVVVDIEEAMENTNELTRDELGRAKRSSHAEGKVGKGMVGVLICEDPKWGRIRVSPGIMDHAARTRFWNDKRLLMGVIIHWRSFGYGAVDAPRFARYYGIKEDV